MTKFTSNVDDFFRKHKDNIERALDKIAEEGLSDIKDETPVITGYLRDSNDYSRPLKAIGFFNTADYAPYVHMGTMYQHANPFMMRGLKNNRRKYLRMLKEELSV
jgi:HK97 gp10 family phage protein